MPNFLLVLVINKDRIQTHSALIAQMIFFWCEAWKSKLDAPFDAILKPFYFQATNYYEGRIAATIKRADSMDKYRKEEVHQNLAYSYLNLEVSNISQTLEILGLFVSQDFGRGGGRFV